MSMPDDNMRYSIVVESSCVSNTMMCNETTDDSIFIELTKSTVPVRVWPLLLLLLFPAVGVLGAMITRYRRCWL